MQLRVVCGVGLLMVLFRDWKGRMVTILAIFQASISHAILILGVRPRTFNSLRDYEAFLNEATNITDPREVAILALRRLLAGRMDDPDKAVAIAVTQFLDETLGVPPEDADGRLRLRAILEIIPNTDKQYRIWIDSWYS
jgi:hypothetical protein